MRAWVEFNLTNTAVHDTDGRVYRFATNADAERFLLARIDGCHAVAAGCDADTGAFDHFQKQIEALEMAWREFFPAAASDHG